MNLSSHLNKTIFIYLFTDIRVNSQTRRDSPVFFCGVCVLLHLI